MATYSAVGSTEKDADSPITVSLIDKLDQNPEAMIEGASGAPRIQTAAYDTGSVDSAAIATDAVDSAEIAAGAVAQGELSTANSDHDLTSLASVSPQDTSTSAGLYALSVCVTTGSAPNQSNTHRVGADYSGGDVIAFEGTTRSGVTGANDDAAFRVRYVQSSPPYDMGDGDVPLFVCLAVKKGSGEIHAISSAPDPVWKNNGPTILAPDGTDRFGDAYRWADRRLARELKGEAQALVRDLRRRLSDRPPLAAVVQQPFAAGNPEAQIQRRDAKRALIRLDQEIAAIRSAIKERAAGLEILKRPITMADKMADMTEIPHNYTSWDSSLYDFVYLDPPDTLDLWEQHDSGVFLPTLIREAYTIDNRELNRSVPPGTKAVRFTKR